MSSVTPDESGLAALTRIQRIRGQPGDRYEVIFVDQNGQPVIPLTEWYRLRASYGPVTTRETYLTCLLPFLTFLIERSYSWNAPPDQLRTALVEFYRDRLGCLIQPKKDREGIGIVPTRDTPLRDSTLRVFRAALRDFYLVLREEGLYAFANPLSSVGLIALKRIHVQALANRGAPDHAGIREETHEQSRRLPTAFVRYPTGKAWEPELRKEVADVREGMHKVLDAMIDSEQVPIREKAVLELLQNTGARLHEIVLMTVGGFKNEGIAGQAYVVNKGSYGRENKTIYFAHNPKVEQALTTYLEQVRPLHDPQRRKSLIDVENDEIFFLTERGPPYSLKSFYYHWYRCYEPLRNLCPVRFSPHDIRHLFITEFLITLKQECGAGTEGGIDREQYRREREAFGHTIMGWRSSTTIDIYDHSHDGEHALQVLGKLQQGFSQRHYGLEPVNQTERQAKVLPTNQNAAFSQASETVWLHDAETLAWVKKMQQQTDQR